jgi:hypothetical protein
MSTFIRLLVIDDSEDDSALVNLLLRQAGYALHSERVDTSQALKKGSLCTRRSNFLRSKRSPASRNSR